MKTFKSIDAYILSCPQGSQPFLKLLRETIRKAAPKAEETIKYGIPTFVLNGNLVHFGGYRTHIGFYPASSGMKAFQKELTPYATGKGTARFPLDKPLPLALVRKIVKYRIKENAARKVKRS